MEDPLTREIIGAAMQVHRTLGPGFLESVYANALGIELHDSNVHFEREFPLTVTYRDEIVGEFNADFLVEDHLILEIKAVANLSKAHEVQAVNYLAATGKDIALLLNFGTVGLQFKRKHRTNLEAPGNRESNPVNLVNPVQIPSE